MRKKFRIFSTITAMVLVVLVMCVGIWAATQATVSSTGGDLTFNVSDSDIYAKVSYDSNASSGEFTEEKSVTIAPSANGNPIYSIELNPYVFTSENHTYIFAIKIENLSSNNTLVPDINFTEKDDNSAFDITYSNEYDGSYQNSYTVNDPIAPGDNLTIYVKMELVSTIVSEVSGKISFTISLSLQETV